MSFIAATLFAVAFLLSAYAILLTLAQKWDRIEQVVAMQGSPVERVIHLGTVRYTGQRLRLVVVNELEPHPEQQAFAFGRLRAA
ncbi:hypothetical protein DXH95_07010 [Sphingorhabdus pulchriflava]|uniref:Uncharacterized protein n=1 Tax=Sphingorhabdus pulchriflava TaxID=2292257 RepID=A0A371BHP7_9SPHN|nr:hypothetical protein [Sphingorhabdus pulchriflava]RDV07122.1 hypothetical protein DXH95_07010 [Sphingorhabdus pulchriflava]